VVATRVLGHTFPQETCSSHGIRETRKRFYPQQVLQTCSRIYRPWLRDKVNSGIGLSYRPAGPCLVRQPYAGVDIIPQSQTYDPATGIPSYHVIQMAVPREDWMIYRGPGFLAVVRFGSSLTLSPLSRQQLVSLSQSSRGKILSLWPGYIVDCGIGLSLRPAKLHWLAGRYDNPMPESTISPSGGLRIWLPCVAGRAYTGRIGGGRRAESYDRKQAWPSINRSIFCGWPRLPMGWTM